MLTGHQQTFLEHAASDGLGRSVPCVVSVPERRLDPRAFRRCQETLRRADFLLWGNTWKDQYIACTAHILKGAETAAKQFLNWRNLAKHVFVPAASSATPLNVLCVDQDTFGP